MNKRVILASVLAGGLMASAAFAGNPGQSGQSGQSGQTGGQCGQGCHKPGFFKKMKESFKKGYEAGKKAGTKVYDAAQNKVMDAGVAIKKAVTGKKCKTFVKGHYDKNGKHTKGHFRKVCKNGK